MLHIYYKNPVPEVFEGMLDEHAFLLANDNCSFVFDCYQDDEHAALSFFEKWNERKWLKRNLPDNAKIVVFSEFTANLLRTNYHKTQDHITVRQPKVDAVYRPIDDDAKDVVRYRETSGDAYFLYRGPIHPAAELKNLLKGFSIFKKKMGSNMKLVLCGPISKKSKAFIASLDTYKYKRDVIVKHDVIDDADLIAAAYALVHPCRWERFGFSVLKAIKSGVAVLTVEHSAMSEFAGMAGMFFNEKNPEDIGEKMIRIFKDEQMRQDMIGTGLSRGL
jgi:glycosyltransferase involved in cell wall biosynthesis